MEAFFSNIFHESSAECECAKEDKENYTSCKLKHVAIHCGRNSRNLRSTARHHLCDILRTLPFHLVVVFVEDAGKSHLVSIHLKRFGFRCSVVNEKMRKETLEHRLWMFNNQTSPRVLVSSCYFHAFDLPNVTFIINFDAPLKVWQYRHRVSTLSPRKGLVVTITKTKHQQNILKQVAKEDNLVIEPFPENISIDEYMDVDDDDVHDEEEEETRPLQEQH